MAVEHKNLQISQKKPYGTNYPFFLACLLLPIIFQGLQSKQPALLDFGLFLLKFMLVK